MEIDVKEVKRKSDHAWAWTAQKRRETNVNVESQHKEERKVERTEIIVRDEQCADVVLGWERWR